MKGAKRPIPLWPAVAVLLLAAGCSTTPTPPPAPHSAEGAPESAAEIYAQLGLEYMKRGTLDLALVKFRRSLQLNPKLPSAHLYIAQLYGQLGESEAADSHYREALSLDPSYSAAHNNYGVFLCREKRFPEAEEHLLKAVKDPLYRNRDEAYENLGLCALLIPDKAKAEGYFLQALNLNAALPKSLLAMAQLSFDAGQYAQSRGYLRRHLEVAKPSPASLGLAIQVERQMGDKNAEASYTLLLKRKFPDSEEARQLVSAERQSSSSGRHGEER